MVFDPMAKAGKFNTNPATSGIPSFGRITAMYDPPLDGDWTKYTRPFSASNPGGGTSKFDPTKTVPICEMETPQHAYQEFTPPNYQGWLFIATNR